MRLAIGLPLTSDKEYSAFWDSFVVMQKPAFDYLRPSFQDTRIDRVRNELVRRAMQVGASQLLLIDTDQVLDPLTVKHLTSTMARQQCAAVGAVIYRRYPPYDPLVFLHDNVGLYKPTQEQIYSAEDFEVYATGCGCVLYDLQVFDEIEPPWFEDKSDQDGAGEDIDFCYKLQEHGFKIFVNTKADVTHLAPIGVNRAFFELTQKIHSVVINHSKAKGDE